MDDTAQTSSPVPWGLRIGFVFCIVVSLAVVIRRVVALASPSASVPAQMAGLDEAFASHAALTLAHILPAFAFVLISPFALLRRFSQLVWPDLLLFPLGLVVGLTAYAMSAYAVGGWIERSAVFLFDTVFLASLARAWAYRRHQQGELKRRWLTRAIAVLLGIATTRPVMGVFFATSSRTHLMPRQFFGVAFWIGFSINWLVIELWLRKRRAAESPLLTAAVT